jgi:hypothetical protein
MTEIRPLESKLEHSELAEMHKARVPENREVRPEIHCEFHGSFTEEEKKIFAIAQEEDVVRLQEYLRVNRPMDVKFQVFETRDEKQAADPLGSPSRASARFAEMMVYRQWTSEQDAHFPHEITHLLAHTWGEPYSWEVRLPEAGRDRKHSIEMVSTSFLQEGLALAVDELVFARKWTAEGNSRSIDEWCQMYYAYVEQITSLSQCMNFDQFNRLDARIAMPLAGSFVKFLIQTHGLEKFRALYTHTRETQLPTESVAVLEVFYGVKEDELLRQWKESLFVTPSNT